MPLSLMSGESWEESRTLLAKYYSDLVLVSIAGAGSEEMSFSADTGMGECLIVGRRTGTASTRATFVVLKERPAYPLLGAGTADQIRHLIAGKRIRHLEDGPVGGTHLYSGSDIIGQVMDAPLPSSGGWNLARIADLSLAQTAYQVINKGRIWLPTMEEIEAVSVTTTTVERIGEVGPIHRDINGTNVNGSIRGPFTITPVSADSVPTYPVLWSHDAKRERTMLFEAESEAIPRQSSKLQEQQLIDLKVAAVWKTASHCHFNCDFQFNSQSTNMQFTHRKSIGGRAWLSIKLSSIDQEKALVVWGNTTLGILLRWWHSNKQQSGRGNIGKQSLQNLPILDIAKLTSNQLSEAVSIFDAMSQQQLLPVHEMDKDPVRKELDNQFARRVLGLPEKCLTPDGPLDLLRRKLSREPSIRGHK